MKRPLDDEGTSSGVLCCVLSRPSSIHVASVLTVASNITMLEVSAQTLADDAYPTLRDEGFALCGA
jgi:hypothetical protein